MTECWTHTIPPGLDVLKTSSTGYLVSCKGPCGDREDVTILLTKSKHVIIVNAAGTLNVSVMVGEPGVYAVIKTPVDNSECGGG